MSYRSSELTHMVCSRWLLTGTRSCSLLLCLLRLNPSSSPDITPRFFNLPPLHCLPLFFTSLGVSSWKLNSSWFWFRSEFGSRDFPPCACHFSSPSKKLSYCSSRLRLSFLSRSFKTQTSFIKSLFRSPTFPLFSKFSVLCQMNCALYL